MNQTAYQPTKNVNRSYTSAFENPIEGITHGLLNDLMMGHFHHAEVIYRNLVSEINFRGFREEDVIYARDSLYRLRTEARSNQNRDVYHIAGKYAKGLHVQPDESIEARFGSKVSRIVRTELNGTGLYDPLIVQALIDELEHLGDVAETVSPTNITKGYILMTRFRDKLDPRTLARTFVAVELDPSKLEMLLSNFSMVA